VLFPSPRKKTPLRPLPRPQTTTTVTLTTIPTSRAANSYVIARSRSLLEEPRRADSLQSPPFKHARAPTRADSLLNSGRARLLQAAPHPPLPHPVLTTSAHCDSRAQHTQPRRAMAAVAAAATGALPPPLGNAAPFAAPPSPSPPASSRRFAEALIKSIGVIGASEIGDKTFFIAALMAMRHPRWTVFSGALGALAAMTVLSAALGWAAPALIPKVYTHYAATALFFFFGGKTLYDVLSDGEGGGGHGGGGGGGSGHHHEPSELEQVEQELAEREAAGGRPRAGSRLSLKDAELPYHAGGGAGGSAASGLASALAAADKALRSLLSPVLLNAFTLTFLAEWGDRSQIATIGLAASQDVVGVTLGSIVGHAACTGVAVLGGRHLAAHIDERTVGIVGGLIFLAFGLHSLYEGPPE